LKPQDNAALQSIQKKKRTVGIIAIAFLLLFTVLAVLGVISSWEWLITDAVVFVTANLILRRLRPPIKW
jgi:hypothetical protein